MGSHAMCWGSKGDKADPTSQGEGGPGRRGATLLSAISILTCSMVPLLFLGLGQEYQRILSWESGAGHLRVTTEPDRVQVEWFVVT